MRWTKVHHEKARLAGQLFRGGKLSLDVSNQLLNLNELRKDVSYGEPGHDLAAIDLDELTSDLEHFIDEVDSLVSGLEE